MEKLISKVNLLRAVSPGTILAAKLRLLTEQAKAGETQAESFLHLLKEAEQLASGLEPYIEKCTTPESQALAKLVADTQNTNWKEQYDNGHTSLELESEMVSGNVEAQFLKMLIRLMKATRVLEIGLFTGYSALAMAEALPTSGKLVACEVDAFAADFARRQFAKSPHGHKIEVEVGEAAHTIQRLSDRSESFDLIFIDADKAGYLTYFNIALEGSLLAPDGVICVDNTLLQGLPYTASQPSGNGLAIAQFNQAVADDPRVEQVLLPLRDGLTLIRRIQK